MTQDQQLFINDQRCDLDNDSLIGLTFQINDLGDVQNQQGNTSNQFKIPNTQNNRRIFGFPDDIQMCQREVYGKLDGRYIRNGVEVFANAFAEVNASNEQQIALTLLSGNVDFFDLLGGQLADMGDSTSQYSNYGQTLVWKPYDHVWNLQNAAGSQKNTASSGNNGIGGWIYPLVDYGLFSDDFTLPIDVHSMRPGFFIKTAIDLLVKSTGYLAKGSLLKNPLYPLLIAQFSNGSWEHGVDYQNQPDEKGVVASLGQNLNITHPNASQPFPRPTLIFNNIISNPSNFYNVGTGVYTVNQVLGVNISLKIPELFFLGHIDSTYGSSLDINIVYIDPINGEVVLAGITYDLTNNPTRIFAGSLPTQFGYTTILNQTLGFQTDLPVNGKIKIEYDFKGYTGSQFSMKAGAELTIKANNQDVLFGQTVQCEKIFPDTSQKDLLKDTLQRFGIICQTDVYSKTINFASLKDIVSNIGKAYNWTSKCLNQGKDVEYKLSDNYAQVNYLEYQVDPNAGPSIIPPRYGWSKIVINDKTLSPYPAELIVSMFGASLNRPFVGGVTALVQMIDPTTGSNDFSISVAPRILISNKVDLLKLGKTIHFTDDPDGDLNDPDHNIFVNDVVDCPYFFKTGGEHSLMWDDLKLMNYSELMQILKDTKKPTRYFLLSEQDIKDLDLLIPVYLEQDNAYYYINNIEAWQPNVPTKVTLVKLG